VDHRGLGDALDVNVVEGLPGSELVGVGGVGVLRGDVGQGCCVVVG